MKLRELSCEGYKMFYGTMLITPKNDIKAFTLNGDWLFKPDTNCWYCRGSSFPENICQKVAIFVPDEEVII